MTLLLATPLLALASYRIGMRIGEMYGPKK